MVHNGSPSLHAILEELVNKDNSTSSDGESFSFPVLRECIVVTSTMPVMTTPRPEETPTLQTIPMVLLWAAVHQPNIRHLPERLLAYQEERQCDLHDDIKHGATQRWGEVTSERAVVEAQLVKLHQCKSMLEAERATTTNCEEW
jgi:hypothetical protein